MKKRLLAVLLAVVMTAVLLPATALAADGDFVIENGALTKYNGPGGAVVIPDGVTSIGMDVFLECINLTSVTIPESVTYIKPLTFYGCTGLTSVTLPGSVVSIGDSAFSDCTSLANVTLPENMTSIGEGAFSGCIGLTDVIIPKNVTRIEKGAFCGCTGLVSVVIPGNVDSIGAEAFSYCTNLTDVTIQEGTTKIESVAFQGCVNLTDVIIPESVTDFGTYIFFECSNLTIHGYTGSTAERYCALNGISFAPMDVAPGTAQSGTMTSDSGAVVEWDITEEGKVSVSAGLGQDEKVLVACYDDQGRFVGAKWITVEKGDAQIDPATPNVKLFWLGANQSPLSPSATVWGK